MKRILLTWVLAFLCIHLCSSQGIRISEDDIPPDQSAILDIQSSNKGVLIPRTVHTNIENPAEGLLVYDTETHSIWFFNGEEWIEDSPWVSSGEHIYYNRDGNVGIGTNNPQNKLDIQNVADGQGITIDGNGPGLHFGEKEAAIGYATGFGQYSSDARQGDLIIRADNEDNILFTDGAGSSNLFIDGKDGNVAIGTTSTTHYQNNDLAYRLTIQGAYPQIDVQGESTTNGHLVMGYQDTVQSAVFSAFTLDNQGEKIYQPILLLGKNTGINEVSPNASLTVKTHPLNEIALRLESGKFSMAAQGIFEIDSPDTIGGRFVIREDGNVGMGMNPQNYRLQVNGEASKTSGGEWEVNSDARLKKNIRALNSQETLSKMLQMQGVQYEWKPNERGLQRKAGKQYGFIAQDIQTVFPELVSEDAHGYLQTAYGTYDAMYVEAVRALNKKIETLEAQNIELKKQIEKLSDLTNLVEQQQQLIEALEAKIIKE